MVRLRFREWTVRAAIRGMASYLKYDRKPAAERLLDKLLLLHSAVSRAQVRYGTPSLYRIRKRGVQVDLNRQAYATPKFSITELRILREGLELMSIMLRGTGRQMNSSEAGLLWKVKIVYSAMCLHRNPQRALMVR